MTTYPLNERKLEKVSSKELSTCWSHCQLSGPPGFDHRYNFSLPESRCHTWQSQKVIVSSLWIFIACKGLPPEVLGPFLISRSARTAPWSPFSSARTRWKYHAPLENKSRSSSTEHGAMEIVNWEQFLAAVDPSSVPQGRLRKEPFGCQLSPCEPSWK